MTHKLLQLFTQFPRLRPLKKYVKLTLPYADKIAISFIVGLFVNLLVLIPPLIVKGLIDVAYPLKDFNLLLILCVIPFALAIMLQLLSVMKSILDLYTDQHVFRELYQLVYSKINRLPLRFFHEVRTGDLIYRMTDDLNVIERTLLSTVPSFLSAIIKLTCLLVICLSLNVSLTGLALMTVPIYFWETRFFSKKLKGINQENQEQGARIYDRLEERLSNIKLIKLYKRWTTEVRQLLADVTDLFIVERKARVTASLQSVFTTLVVQGWAVLLALYGGYLIIHDQLSIGEMVAITFYIGMLRQPFDNMSKLYKSVQTASVSFERIDEILGQKVEHTETVPPGKLTTFEGKISFENVSFSHLDDKAVLNDISFEVEKGSSLAIVGKSGIGKSSIVDLLLRFYPINSGNIAVDDKSIQDYDLYSLRRQIGLINQNAVLFYGSIRENITFGLEWPVSDSSVEKAARLADAHDFIMELADGYETQVGPGGSNLSSGQRQRVAIARALVMDPKVLVFDEATAALDGESEKQIQRSIERLKGEKTIIIIAHRLSAIIEVDNVVVIGNDGRIVEKGRVLELLDAKGQFYKLYELQLGGYTHFMQQLAYMLKSVKRYNRPLSVALVRIDNYKDLVQHLEERHLDHIVNQLGITISLFMRDVDTCRYQSDGLYWVAMPETDEAGAKIACERLMDHIAETTFRGLANHSLDMNWAAEQCRTSDEIDQLTVRLKTGFNSEDGVPA